MTDFLTDYGVVVALGCAATAVVYGLLITQRLLDNQKDFAKNLLDASAPVRNKAKRPVAPVTATKAAKSKAA